MRFSASFTSNTLTDTSCPTWRTSWGVAICLWAIWEIWTNPSTPGNNSTNAPNAAKRLTVPTNVESTAARSAILSQGPGTVSLIDNETRPFSASKPITFASTVWPTAKKSLGFDTCSWEISETWTNPSIPPKSMNAPKFVKRATLPVTIAPS